MHRAAADRGVSGWCAECEYGHCRHIPPPVLESMNPVAEETKYEERMAEVGLTEEVLDEVFLSSGQSNPRHERDLGISHGMGRGRRFEATQAPLVLVLIRFSG